MPKIQQQQQQDQVTNLRFLRMVKRFPEIYNPSHDLADDKAHSMVVWEKISCELDAPVSALKKKWQKLCSMHKKKLNSNNDASQPSSSRDEVFNLMGSMFKIPGVSYPCDTDDSSLSSAPTLSIISEEGGNRSTRSSSSSSSTLIGDGEDRPREGGDPKSFGKENASPSSSSQAMAVPSSSSSSYSSAASSGNKINANLSTRVLRSHNLRFNRTTRSGPPEISARKNPEKDSQDSNLSRRYNSRSNFKKKTRHSVSSSENRDRNIKRSNETIGKFFQNLSITFAKFPANLRNDARIKISKIVNDAEIELKSLSSNSI